MFVNKINTYYHDGTALFGNFRGTVDKRRKV